VFKFKTIDFSDTIRNLTFGLTKYLFKEREIERHLETFYSVKKLLLIH